MLEKQNLFTAPRRALLDLPNSHHPGDAARGGVGVLRGAARPWR